MEEPDAPKRASSSASEPKEPNRKRQKLSPAAAPSTTQIPSRQDSPSADMATPSSMLVLPQGAHREEAAGIRFFVSTENCGFSGILKQRYTDFLVNEIDLDGSVLHLTKLTPKARTIPRVLLSEQTSKTTSSVAESSKQAPEQTGDTQVYSREVPDVNTNIAWKITPEDDALLEKYFGSRIRMDLLNLHQKIQANTNAKPASFGSLLSDPINDRQLRTQIHMDVRRIFDSVFETTSDSTYAIKISAAPRVKPVQRERRHADVGRGGDQRPKKGKLDWDELGGPYLHFTLYKENKDTMEVIKFISKKTHQKDRTFSFAGTKDRRAVTVQRVSAFRMRAEDIAHMNKILYGSKVGNFSHQKHELQLGDLSGNEFLITLRDCHFPGIDESASSQVVLTKAKKVVGDAVEKLQKNGFLNYYGLQRFGSYSFGTDLIGMKILQGDYEGAVNCILSYDEDMLDAALTAAQDLTEKQMQFPKDDMDRAYAIFKFNQDGKPQIPLDRLPRRFGAEAAIIRHLGNNHRAKDFQGALQQITRNLRLMYVHAYQSLVWNHAASHRWARHESRVIAGDLVLVDTISSKAEAAVQQDEVDQDGEVVVLPATDDVAITSADIFQRARALTAEEAACGKYSIFDIVLPTPGYDIEYPANDVGDFYKEFMKSEQGGNLNPGDMRRQNKDFSLSGSYRKLMGQITHDITYEVRTYKDDNEQMVQTDLEKLTGERRPEPKMPSAPVAPDDKDAAIAAWKALPAKLAAEDKGYAEALALKREEKPIAKLGNITYKDTYIQTAIKDGKAVRTGFRETVYIPPADGSEMPPPPPPHSMDRTTMLKIPSILKTKEVLSNESDYSDSDDYAVTSGSSNKTESASIINVLGKDSVDNAESLGNAELVKKTEPVGETKSMDKIESLDSEEDGIGIESLKIAVLVKFQLGSSQYATMALRELMKAGGLQPFKPEFFNPRRM